MTILINIIVFSAIFSYTVIHSLDLLKNLNLESVTHVIQKKAA